MVTVSGIIAGVIDREQGYVDHPSDRGGPTNYGITQAVARERGYTGDMRDLPKAIAIQIYEDQYIKRPGFDKVLAVSEPIAVELIDTYVNMGAGNAQTKDGPIYWLQRWLNALNERGRAWADIGVDGAIGNLTIASLKAFIRKRGKDGELYLAEALNCLQGARYLKLIEARELNEDFANGWLRTRVWNGHEREARQVLAAPEPTLEDQIAEWRTEDTMSIPEPPKTYGDARMPEVLSDDKPSFMEWIIGQFNDRKGKSTVIGIAGIGAALLSDPTVFSSLQGVGTAIATGKGLPSIILAVFGVLGVLVRERPKQ